VEDRILAKGVHFCLVKGVTHRNSDGSSRSDAMKLCSIGDTVKLVPEPWNEHDRNAIAVVLLTGQQIGYISARQAARFAGIVHLLTATVHSRAKDDWGNDTLKLRVLNSAEQHTSQEDSSPDGTITAQPTPAKQAAGSGGCLAALIVALLLLLLFVAGGKSCP